MILAAGIAGGQERFPSKSVQLIVPLASGSIIDIIARVVGEKLSPSAPPE